METFLLLLIFFFSDLLIVVSITAYNRPYLARQVFSNPDETAGEKISSELNQKVEALQTGLLCLHAVFWLAIGFTLYAIHQSTDLTLSAWFRSWGLLILVGLILLCEWVIQTIVETRNERWADILIPFARLITDIAYPLQQATDWLAHKVAVEQLQSAEEVEEEIMEWVDNAQEEGELESEKGRLIHSIFDLSNTLAREIMVPRVDIIALESNMSIDEAIATFTRSGHSRLPLYHESVDEISGLVYAKDLLRMCQNNMEDISLEKLARPAYFIPEAKQLDELLAEMQQRRIHLAIVVDEYGGVAGLVTLEDIIEELLGEIQDEFDQAEELPYQMINDTEGLFLGKIDLDDFNEVMQSAIPKEEADTLGGFIYKQLGRVPTTGEILTIGDLELKVEQVSGRRIRKVLARRIEKGENQDERQID